MQSGMRGKTFNDIKYIIRGKKKKKLEVCSRRATRVSTLFPTTESSTGQLHKVKMKLILKALRLFCKKKKLQVFIKKFPLFVGFFYNYFDMKKKI